MISILEFVKRFANSNNSDSLDDRSSSKPVTMSAQDARFASMQAAIEYNLSEIEDEEEYKKHALEPIEYLVQQSMSSIDEAIGKQCAVRKGELTVFMHCDYKMDSKSSASVLDGFGGIGYSVHITIGHKTPLDERTLWLQNGNFFTLPTPKHRMITCDALKDEIVARYEALGYKIDEKQPHRMTFSSNPPTIPEERSREQLCTLVFSWADGENFEENLRSLYDVSQIRAYKKGVPLSDIVA